MSLKVLFEEYDQADKAWQEKKAELELAAQLRSDKVKAIAQSPEVGGKKMVVRGGIPHTIVKRSERWFFRTPKSGSVEVED